MRRALLIATAEYADPTLASLDASRDASALATVLADPALGGFDELDVLTDAGSATVARRLEGFFVDADRGDTVLLYLSGHGLRDQRGHLYFATADTRLDRLRSTAVPASLVHQLMDEGPRSQIVVLDCCYSGAFVRGMNPKGASADLPQALGPAVPDGRGRIVLTATDQIQWAFEDPKQPAPSVYTRALLEGIATGAADRDGDGLIGAEEAHDHAAAVLREQGHGQQPRRWSFGVSDGIYLASAGSELPVAVPPSPLPPHEPATTAPAGGRRLRVGAGALAAAGAAVVALTGLGLDLIGGDGSGSRSSPLRTGAYLVTVTGSAAGVDTFELQGALRIRSDEDLPVQVCLEVGNPFGAPAPGAIWFGSHDSCPVGGPGAPLVTAGVVGDELQLSPLADLPAGTTSTNGFAVSGSVTSCGYDPRSGTVALSSDGGREISGVINLRGLDLCGSAGQGQYTATLRATLVDDDADGQISSPGGPGGDVDSVTGADGDRYVVEAVTRFENADGSAASDAARARFAGAVLVVEPVDGGSFTYAPADARTDVFPLEGTVAETGGGTFLLTGVRTTGEGSTFAEARVDGLLDLSGDQPYLRLQLDVETAIGASSQEAEGVLRPA